MGRGHLVPENSVLPQNLLYLCFKLVEPFVLLSLIFDLRRIIRRQDSTITRQDRAQDTLVFDVCGTCAVQSR